MIQMSGIVKRFGQQTVLSGVTFEVQKQEIFGLLGPSGAGKTTIINILTNQLTADSGGHSIGAAAAETGLMLDEDGLYVRLSCVENLNVFADIYAIPRKKSLEALKSVGLADAAKKPVNKLSRGMRQRLALARAILHSPKILFLDEPTRFLTTHNMEEAVKLCDSVALLHKGQIVESGAPLDICTRHNAMKTVPDLESVFIKLTGVELE